MGYKTSKYNYYTDSNEDGLILYNSYIGLPSICKVKKEDKETVISIFQSEKPMELDTELKKLMMERGFLVPEGEDELQKLKLLYLRGINRQSLGLVILPTENCNYRCKYCYESFERGKMSKDVQDGIVEYVNKNVHNYKAVNIGWFGGEPLLEVPMIEELSDRIMKICNQHHVPYLASVTSNGYLLTPDVLKRLLKRKVTNYTITIDGVKETHDAQKPLANGKPTFDTVIGNLLAIRDTIKNRSFHISIRTNFTETMYSYIDEYMDTFYQYFGEDSRFSFFARPVGNWGGDRVKK